MFQIPHAARFVIVYASKDLVFGLELHYKHIDEIWSLHVRVAHRD